MMKLRVTVEPRMGNVPADEPGLQTLYRSADVVVHGSADVVSVDQPGGGRLLLAGDVLGLRTRAGGLEGVGAGELSLRATALSDVARCREALEGRYVVVVIGADGSIQIGADRFGRVDVYRSTTGARTVLSTDLDLIRPSGGPGGFDPAAVAHVTSAYGWRPPKRHTLYRGVGRLGVGDTVVIRGGRVEIAATPFRPVPVGAYGPRELDEYADILLESVAAAGSQYGNVVYLSSGWDSTSLLACLVKIFGARKVRAVIGRMQYSERSGVINQFELDRARAVADYYGVRLDVAEFDLRHRVPAVFERLRPQLRAHQMAGGTTVTHGTLADFVARTTGGDETVFAGEISDGAHNLGYSQFATIFHPSLQFREYADKMGSYLFGPTFVESFRKGQHAGDLMYTLFRDRCAPGTIFDEPAGDDVGRMRQIFTSFFLRGYRLPLWSLGNMRMLTEQGRKLYESEMATTYLERAAQDATPDTLYAWYLHLYNSFHWQGSTVATMSMTADAYGLRLALPFWDSRLQEFLSAMPESWGRGLDLNPTKYPLKWMLGNRIDYPMHLQVGPHSYLYDVDHTFSHAAETLYRSAMGPFFRDRLRTREYRDLFTPETFDVRYIDSIVDRYLAGDELQGAEMGDLVTMCWLVGAGWYGGA